MIIKCPDGYAWGYGHQGWWDGLIGDSCLVPFSRVPEREDANFIYGEHPVYGSRLRRDT